MTLFEDEIPKYVVLVGADGRGRILKKGSRPGSVAEDAFNPPFYYLHLIANDANDAVRTIRKLGAYD